MPNKKITFRILRYKPGYIDPARYQEFSLELDPEMSVPDALETLRLNRDATLMYRHSCHHSSCGTCACKINGRERLTCTTKFKELKGNTITLAPLEGFKLLGDLVVDMSPFYDDISEDWSYLKKSEYGESAQLPEGIQKFERFENCIECGACVSACPATHKNKGFMGPAALAAVNIELKKSAEKSENLLCLAANERGERLCELALNCSRVCPTGVYPARHIADLRKLIDHGNKGAGSTGKQSSGPVRL